MSVMQQKSDEWIEEPIYTVNGQRVVKRYKKLKVVGEGSYSKCWLVRTANSDSTYVVKIIPKKKLELLVKQKLVYEIRIHQQLSHQNVVHLDHWFEDENFQYIFMEYCSEGNLEKRLQAKGKLNEKEIRYFTREIIQAIIYIHSKYILHRDLKLCNFYIDANDHIKLGDFGFACQLSHPNELKRETCGTPNYIAPEAISGFGYSYSSDVWAVGVILFRLKFKCCPFEGKSVKETLEKVKTCQYSFPKDGKISTQLKDLIQKIFVINYDDRLSLTQILQHPFFAQNSPRPSTAQHSRSEPRGFSLLRNIFSKEKDSKEEHKKQQRGRQRNRPTNEKEKKKDQPAKRSNSCQTFKQIKEIFKNKSKGTLVTNMGTEMKTQESIGGTVINQSVRDRSSLGNSTMRSIAQTTLSMNLINKRLEQNSRVNHFMGSFGPSISVKDQLKLQAKPPVTQVKAVSISQQLINLSRKHYLPYEIQFQKQVVIIHYKDSIKQIIYNGSSYIVHRNKSSLYLMNGQPFFSPPKLLKYLIDNKIEVSQNEPQEAEYGENTIEKILLFISHRWIILKDGIILRYGNQGTFIAKMSNQQLFYIGSLNRQGERLREDGKQSLMYTRESNSYKCVEGVVFSRIYQGWIANAFKSAPKE